MRMVKRMRNLIGPWRLVEWTFTVDDSRPTRPWGGNPAGLLTYTDDGRMSASLMSLGRPDAPTRTLSAAPIDIRAALHSMCQPGRPRPTGDGHDLVLSTPPTRTDGGRTAVNRLRWTRIDGGGVSV